MLQYKKWTTPSIFFACIPSDLPVVPPFQMVPAFTGQTVCCGNDLDNEQAQPLPGFYRKNPKFETRNVKPNSSVTKHTQKYQSSKAKILSPNFSPNFTVNLRSLLNWSTCGFRSFPCFIPFPPCTPRSTNLGSKGRAGRLNTAAGAVEPRLGNVPGGSLLSRKSDSPEIVFQTTMLKHPPENSLRNPWMRIFDNVFGGYRVYFKMTLYKNLRDRVLSNKIFL